MQLQVFRLLQVILRGYSRQSPKHLIDNYLRIRIVLKVGQSSAQTFVEQLGLPHAEQVVFCAREKSRRGRQFVCIVVDHPLGLPLGSSLMEAVEQIVVAEEGGQCNNIFGNQQCGQRATRAVLFKSVLPSFQQFTGLLDSFLSVAELFFGHLHLVVSCFEAGVGTELREQVRGVEGDEFADFRQQGYFRILQERANRVTLQQLSDACRVQRCEWGEMQVFEGGMEVLMVWVTQGRLPLLGVVPEVVLSRRQERAMPVFLGSELGVKVFKRKEVWKEPLEELDATTIIFNVKEYSETTRNQIGKWFTAEANSFFSRSLAQRERVMLDESVEYCKRVCQILDLPLVPLLKQLMKNGE